jgi:hypothetical protein
MINAAGTGAEMVIGWGELSVASDDNGTISSVLSSPLISDGKSVTRKRFLVGTISKGPPESCGCMMITGSTRKKITR